MEREEQIVELLYDIRRILAYHQASSIDSYPASTDLSSFFTTCQQLSVVEPEALVKTKQSSSRKSPMVSRQSDHAGLAEIAADVRQCKSCSLAKQRTTVSGGHGKGRKVRLFLVGHWLSVSDKSNTQVVFGVEEDRMLERMLAAIHLSMEDVFVTNVIKCGLSPGIQPQAEHIDACLSYLQRQIAAASPELICTMGMVATKTLLRLSQPLSRLRGRFYKYQGVDGIEIPLLPTYHPGYLLQNPEMKQATWSDLQALEKRLQK
ncbi:MAG: uracil-DNA glycosylase [Thermodesulfobacteriota bacterium]|nr:uracil-DNA glycosylase [Thermodesulfobacteriota bacterium]